MHPTDDSRFSQFWSSWHHSHGSSRYQPVLVAIITKGLTKFIQHCSTCSIAKSSHQCPAGLLQPLPIPQRPWSHITIDFVTDLPRSRNHTTILTVIDRFSKACRLIPLTKLPTAFETAEALLEQVFRFYGLPEDIVSDRGPQFTSIVWSAFCHQININISLTSGYHPESNGQVERLNQELTRFLRSYCHNNQNDWSRYLLWAEYAQNSLHKTSTGLTPFQCVLGFQPPLFPWSGEPSDLPLSMIGYTAVRKPGIQLTFLSNMLYAGLENRPIAIGDQVLPTLRASGCGCPPEISVFVSRAKSSVPGMWLHLK